MKSISSLCTFLIFISLNANADFRTIAASGQQAADFSSGFIYGGLLIPVIGNGGHIAFSGRAANSKGINLSAIWLGKPGQLRNIIKKGDIVNDFSVAKIFVSSFKLIVSDSGSIGFEAGMVDSKDSLLFTPQEKHNGSYLASINGSIVGVIQVNGHAPGFAAETTVKRLDKFLFSDAGMAIRGKTSSLLEAIWFWNNEKVNLIVIRGDDNAKFFPGCFVIRPYLVDLNQKGELLFYTEFQPNGEIDCPSSGLFTWKEGVFRTAVASGLQISDSSVEIEFKKIGVSNISKSSINNAGDVSFIGSFIIQTDPKISRTGSLLARNNGDIEFVMLSQEKITLFSSEPLPFIMPIDSASNAFGKSVGKAHGGGGEIILSGETMPINSITTTQPGETHLTVLAHKGIHAPGLGPDWVFSQQNYGQHQINNLGRIIFSDRAFNKVILNKTGFVWGIWGTDSHNELNLVIANGQPIKLDGKNQTLDHINDLAFDSYSTNTQTATSTNSAAPSSFNDLNQLVLSGRFAETLDQVIIFHEENDCVVTYKNDGTLTIPCVALTDNSKNIILYQAVMKQLSTPAVLSFELITAKKIEGIPLFNSCFATFNPDGLLTLPCIRVTDISNDNSQMYWADLKIIPSSKLLAFTLSEARQHN